MLSYSMLTNYGKTTLPSVDSWGTNMNILRDPPKSITTRQVFKVGQTSSITEMIEDSENRACEVILPFARGINPMVGISYDNNGRNGGQSIENGTYNTQATLPYKVIKDGAFRPPIIRQEQLMPLSRQPRRFTQNATNKQFINYANRALQPPSEIVKEIKQRTLQMSTIPNSYYKIDLAKDVKIDTANYIQNKLYTDITSNINDKSVNPVPTINPESMYETINSPLAIYPTTNVSTTNYDNNNTDFNPDRYIQHTPLKSVISNNSYDIGVTYIYDDNDMNNIKTKNVNQIEINTNLQGISKDKIIHKDLSLNRVLPNYDMTTTKTSFTKNNVVDDEKVYERNLPLTSFSTSINKVGDTQSNVNRDVKLIYRPSFGQLESIPTIPMLNRMQDVKYMKDNTYTLNKKKISEMIKNR